jgi:hypothetical protein
MGRIATYGDDVREEILQRIATGETLASICKDAHMPQRAIVYKWRMDDPEFDGRFAQARLVGHDAIADNTLEIADALPAYGPDGKIDPADVANRKLRIWTRQQLLAKWDPKRYGDRQQVEHSGGVTLESLVSASLTGGGNGSDGSSV